jgi:hypothetical protein
MTTNSLENEMTADIVSLLWRNPRIAKAFTARTEGWERLVSDALGAPCDCVLDTIRRVGDQNLRNEVENNPAGSLKLAKAQPERDFRSIDTEECPTRVYCGTSECGTSSNYCPTVRGCG